MKSSMTNICTIVPQSTGNEEEESQAAAQLVLGGKMMLHDGKKHLNNVFLIVCNLEKP